MTATGLALGSLSLFAKPKLRRTSFGLREVVQGFTSAGVLYVIFQIGDRVARSLLPSSGQQIEQIYDLDRLRPRTELMARLTFVIAPAEELFWRGFVQNELMSRLGTFWGTIVGVASYGGVHITSGNLTLIAAATVAGGFWGGLYALGMPLGGLIVSHIVWDNFIFLISPTSGPGPGRGNS
jgi:membrane protease YdiL (CAAX protease family)